MLNKTNNKSKEEESNDITNYIRNKRDTASHLINSSSSSFATDSIDSNNDILSCGPTDCTRLICLVDKLPKDKNIVVQVRSRLWVDTIEKVSFLKYTKK